MAPLDIEMAQMLHETIRENGVDLHLGDGVSSFADKGDKVLITLTSGATVTADLVILSIGVKPNGELAKAAGLEINQRGGIVADEYMKTSDPSIYAVGDVIEVNDLVLGGKTMPPILVVLQPALAVELSIPTVPLDTLFLIVQLSVTPANPLAFIEVFATNGVPILRFAADLSYSKSDL